MSALGKLFGKRQDDQKNEQELIEDEETPDAFADAQPTSQEPEPDPLAASTTPEGEDSTAQQEQGEGKGEDDVLALFGVAHRPESDLGDVIREIEDVPIQELLVELHSVAALLGRPLAGEEKIEEAA